MHLLFEGLKIQHQLQRVSGSALSRPASLRSRGFSRGPETQGYDYRVAQRIKHVPHLFGSHGLGIRT